MVGIESSSTGGDRHTVPLAASAGGDDGSFDEITFGHCRGCFRRVDLRVGRFSRPADACALDLISTTAETVQCGGSPHSTERSSPSKRRIGVESARLLIQEHIKLPAADHESDCRPWVVALGIREFDWQRETRAGRRRLCTNAILAGTVPNLVDRVYGAGVGDAQLSAAAGRPPGSRPICAVYSAGPLKPITE